MKQGAGDPGRDGEQVALSEEDFDLAGAGEFGKVDGAAAADAGGGGLVGGNGGELWKELAWVDKKGFDCSSFSCVRVGEEVECRHVVVDKRDGGKDSSTRARVRSQSLGMTEFAFGLRCIPYFSLRTISGEHLDVAGFDVL
jgi:hypothetical protein